MTRLPLSATSDLVPRRALQTERGYVYLGIGVTYENFVIRLQPKPVGDVVAGLVLLNYDQLCGPHCVIRGPVKWEGALPNAPELEMLEDDDCLISYLRKHAVVLYCCDRLHAVFVIVAVFCLPGI